MLRKLLIIACLTSTVTITFAQKKKKNKGKDAQATVTEAAAINYKEAGAPMPAVRLVTKQKSAIIDADIKHNGPTFVMLFNPTCEHCIETTNMIRKNEALFKNTKVVLLATPNQIDNLQYFEDLTHYPQSKLLMVGVDSSGFIDRTYTYGSLPQLNIYDKNRKLVRTFNGPTIDSLKPYIE
ncbi:MAG: hypothetical protein EOP56_11985 [Sphingobacteriales bacterium]|nr:MAG: hypothetical protein EOP56_11985 [Sphingobacteriales bacterium]